MLFFFLADTKFCSLRIRMRRKPPSMRQVDARDLTTTCNGKSNEHISRPSSIGRSSLRASRLSLTRMKILPFFCPFCTSCQRLARECERAPGGRICT
eukprot:767215-Hanusia_phi.AAC.3